MTIHIPSAEFADSKRLVPNMRRRAAAVLDSVRFQLTGAFLIGVPLPEIIRKTYEHYPDDVLSYDTSMLGCVAAIVLGYLIFRKITSLPGTRAIINQIPGFVLAYGIVAAFFFTLRLDFSRQQFVLSFVLVTAFFFILTLVRTRLERRIFALVEGGRTDQLTQLQYVDWIVINRPSQADALPNIPLVADFNYAGLSAEWERYLAEAAIAGRQVFNTKQLRESLEGQVQIDHLSENSFGHLAPDSLYAPAKLYVDVFVSFVALVILSPFMLLIAVAIRLDTRGPALFKQKRMGYRGRPFTVYKFRSMRVQCETDRNRASDMTKSDDDRITMVGHFIRKTRLDELPQLINILLGQMSLIGPRPETLNLSEWYEKKIPFYRYRHIVRPGITGWAQVRQGHVTSVQDVKEKLEYDFYYVRHFSVWLDLLIVIQTLRVILTGHGAK